MHERAIAGLLLVVAAIHLLPLVGLISLDRLSAMYGVSITDNNLAILMRHRAVTFGLLGGFFAYAACKPSLQPLAFTAAFISITSFLYLAASVGGFNEAIHRVVIADAVAMVALAAAVLLYWLKPAS